MLLEFLRPKMDVSDHEVLSVYPGNPTIRVTPSRVAHFVDSTSLERLPSRMSPDYLPRHSTCKRSPWVSVASANAEAASPMGSPLSPAICLMVVSISEQIWSINFKQILSNHHLFIKHIRYVDNCLIFGDSRLKQLPPYEVLLDEGFYAWKTHHPRNLARPRISRFHA